MSRAVAQLVAGHGSALPLFRIGVPRQCAFPDLAEQLLEQSFKRENRVRRIRAKTLAARVKTCTLFIEGLYQAFDSHVPNTAVAFPHSQQFYGTQAQRISEYTYRNVDACYQTLLELGWITYCPGFVDPFGNGQPTTIAPFGTLLERFRETKLQWRKVTYSSDPIIVRLKDSKTGRKESLVLPDIPEVQLLRQQMLQINEFLCDQAFHLNLPNNKIKALALRMASQRYSYEIGTGRCRTRARALNFGQVGLRRIFSQGRLDRGGRLYGGWWQIIPKDYRRFITINGRPTVEVDFSELHPTMLYYLHEQVPPQNIYDLGIRYPSDPAYDPTVEPHKSRRKTIKHFLNALINDENGRHRLSNIGSKRLGLTHEQLKELIFIKHPIIARAVGTDAGSHLQFLDSQIACQVMLRLMSQGIVALPVHDSFLVQEEFQRELIVAMNEAFEFVMGAAANLKAPELPMNGFESLMRRRDLQPLLIAHKESLHNQYVKSWHQQHLHPEHLNLSRWPPYRFPDETIQPHEGGPPPGLGGGAAMLGYHVKQ